MLPSDLLALLDLTTLELAPGSYVDAGLTSSQSDLLFTAHAAGKPAFIYVLFEHQSSVDELMPLRVLKYVVRILDDHVQRLGGGSKALPLPLVVPVVLHHSQAGWTAATAVQQLFAPELLAEPAVAAHVPHLAFQLDDISHLSDDELTRRALGLVPTLTLWALRDARRPGKIEQSMVRWAGAMQELWRSDSGGEALLTIFRYLSLVVQELTPQTILATLAAAPDTEKDALMTTLAERWQAEGEARGRAEGEARGRAEGERLLLHALLERRFGTLSASDKARVASASEDQILRWGARLFDATSLGSLLAE